MRIVAGTHRGRAFDAPEGSDTRPTTDRVREALFSSLFSIRGGFDGAVVLDAFAGSGALGFEALSRGAKKAVFYERDRKAVGVLRRNAKALGFGPDVATIIDGDVMTQGHKAPARDAFDLVFLDPPYCYDSREVLGAIVGMLGGKLPEGAIIVYEHALKNGNDVEKACEELGLSMAKSKKYGKTAVTIIEARSE